MAGYYGDPGPGGIYRAPKGFSLGGSSAEGSGENDMRSLNSRYSLPGRGPSFAYSTGGMQGAQQQGTRTVQTAVDKGQDLMAQAHQRSTQMAQQFRQPGGITMPGIQPGEALAGSHGTLTPFEHQVFAAKQGSQPIGLQRPQTANVGVQRPTGAPDLQGISSSRPASAPGVAAAGVTPGPSYAEGHARRMQQNFTGVAPSGPQLAKIQGRPYQQSPQAVSGYLADSGNMMGNRRVGVQGGGPSGAQPGVAYSPAEQQLYQAYQQYGLGHAKVAESRLEESMQRAQIDATQKRTASMPDLHQGTAIALMNGNPAMSAEQAYVSANQIVHGSTLGPQQSPGGPNQPPNSVATAPVPQAGPANAMTPGMSMAVLSSLAPGVAGSLSKDEDKDGKPDIPALQVFKDFSSAYKNAGNPDDPGTQAFGNTLKSAYGSDMAGQTKRINPGSTTTQAMPPVVRRILNGLSLNGFGDPVEESAARNQELSAFNASTGIPVAPPILHSMPLGVERLGHAVSKRGGAAARSIGNVIGAGSGAAATSAADFVKDLFRPYNPAARRSPHAMKFDRFD